jgi:hypothetical protein
MCLISYSITNLARSGHGRTPRSAKEIDWTDNLVNLNVDRQRVKDSPAYDASTTVDRPYEKNFFSHYDHARSGHLP